jgi:hypothetical protein
MRKTHNTSKFEKKNSNFTKYLILMVQNELVFRTSLFPKVRCNIYIIINEVFSDQQTIVLIEPRILQFVKI